MPEFSLKYWNPNTGSKQRVYVQIDNDHYHPVKLYWEKLNDRDCGLLLHGGYNDKQDFPPLYQDSEDPRQDLAGDALMQQGIDPDDFDWEDLVEASV